MKALLLHIGSFLLLLTMAITARAQSPVIIKDVDPGSLDGVVSQTYLRVGDKIYFWGNDGVTGNELWVTDGTAAGTTLVKEIIPGAQGSQAIDMLGTYQGKLVFMADDSTHGREPWISDGTAAGTYMLADVNPGPAHSLPAYARECLGLLYFQADDGTHGQEPWVSDGTAAGTHLLTDVQPGFGGSQPNYFIEYNGAVYFETYTAAYGYEPWTTTGTSATIFKDLQPGFADGGFIKPCVFNGKLYFGSYTSANGLELWQTDGQPANTNLFADLNPGTGNGFTDGDIDTMGGKMFFSASDGVHGFELWATDGTPAGTTMIKDIDPSGAGSNPTSFARLHDKLYFVASEGISIKNLWATDLITAATEKISLYDLAIANWVRYPTVWRDSLYFFDYGTYNGSGYMNDLFVTGGDSTSVRKVNRLSMQDAINTNSWLDAINNGIVYRAKYDVSTGYELYTLDYPTTIGISAVKDDHLIIYPNPVSEILYCKMDKPFQQATISISDVLGKEMYVATNQTGNQLEVNLHALPTGVYFLRIEDDGRESVQRFFKK